MPTPRGRHRAPRPPRRKGAVAVPVVLLAAGGGAFGGLAGVPAVAGGPGVSAAAASTVRPLDNEPDTAKLDAVALRQAELSRARAAAALRASRSRRAAADAAAALKAAAQKEAARVAAAKKAALEAARPKYVRPAVGPLSSPFGYRWGRLHAGVDIAALYGSQIRAVEDGEIVETGFDAGGYGNFVHVQHDDGTMTTYNHMSKILRRGGHVEAGDVLGLVGSTGHSTGPHLHFEVRVGGEPVNPLPWLRAHGIRI